MKEGNPYPKPGPITDRRLLRGRDSDVAVVRSHLTTRRWTVLHGRSGAGKSSLLAAGIKGDLEPKRLYKLRILDCSGAPRPLFDAVALSLDLRERGLSDVEGKLNIKYGVNGQQKLLLILDQFEQYLDVYDRESDKFLEHLVRNDWFVNVYVGIREDELSRLSRLRTPRFNPFDNLIALRDLSEDEAREIIVGPVANDRERIGFTDVNIGRIIEGLKERQPEGDRILAAVLAIFCYDAWEMVRKGGQPLRDIDQDIKSAIGGYCRRMLNDLCNGRASYERAAVKVLGLLSAHHLRRPVSREELRKNADDQDAALGAVLKDLVDRWLVERTNRGGVDDSYIIVHDRFVEPIEGWVRERPIESKKGEWDEEEGATGKRAKLLEAQRRLAELGLAVAWAERSKEKAREELLELWPEIRNSLDVTAKTVLRWMAIRFEVSSLPARICRESDGATLGLKDDGCVELLRHREGLLRLRMEGKAVGYSFSEDGECVVAYDERELYVWDLAAFLQIKVSFTPAGFASAILSAEDIYRHLVGEVEPETVPPATSTEDLVYTFQDLSGE